LAAAQALGKAPVEVTLIDRSNHHLFQPLLYQVATASLSPADIASPIRKVLRKQSNVEVMQANVAGIDLETRKVRYNGAEQSYDYLVLAAGLVPSYFGNDEWRKYAPPLKTIKDGLEIRRRFLMAFEAAELEKDDEARKAQLTFVIVGGGPTGVELAGTMAEIAHGELASDFRYIKTSDARVILAEGEERLLPNFPEQCGRDAEKQLRSLGVEVQLGDMVKNIDEAGVTVGDKKIESKNLFWAAGLEAPALTRKLGVDLDSAGRVKVARDLTIPCHPEVFVIGDLAHATDAKNGKPIPGLAPAALQAGRYVGRVIRKEREALAAGRPRPEREGFHYADKGQLATIGRNKAVAAIGKRHFKGFLAWLLWAVVHIFFLITFRKKLAVFFNWVWNYFFHERGARLITSDTEPQPARTRGFLKSLNRAPADEFEGRTTPKPETVRQD